MSVIKAYYPLRKQPASFDFFTWLVMQPPGTHVVFDPKDPKAGKFTADEVLRRYESILKPGIALAGLTWEEGTDGDQTPGGQIALLKFVQGGGVFRRLKAVPPPCPVALSRYTVTLRNFNRWPHRNSSADWLTFADEIGARVIPDYGDEPIHLHERMALYAGADMNFFVTNGPVILCFLSEYPAMSFDVQQSPLVKLGIPMGGQYPYLLPNKHRQIYEPGELSVIRKHFYHWRDTGTFL